MYNNPPKTLFIGQKLLFLPECHSTNDMAAELIVNASAPEGTVVITDRQTRGRGQRGNTWQAEPGKNLTFSIVVKPTFLRATQQFQLNIAISMAVHEFLLKYLPQHLSIKWPNDVYWQSYKMGGILIENTVQGAFISHSVIGIGLNINQLSFPSQLRATSLLLAAHAGITEDEYNLEILLQELLVLLEKFYLKLHAGTIDPIRPIYVRRLLGYGKAGHFRSGESVFEGVIVGINDSGQLAIQTGNETHYYSFKEVEFVFER